MAEFRRTPHLPIPKTVLFESSPAKSSRIRAEGVQQHVLLRALWHQNRFPFGPEYRQDLTPAVRPPRLSQRPSSGLLQPAAEPVRAAT
jgi:hypothetical protein